MACLFACGLSGQAAFAQSLPDLSSKAPSSGSQMLLESDTLVYDNDKQTVTAVGGVQIDYGGNRLVAQRVEYDRKTKRLVASGEVQIVQSDGTKINSDHIDITDDFADGFVNALRVETLDKTYFAAESAERMGGVLTTFHNGVYTACAPCEDKPDRAPIWRVKARKIIWNGQKHTVRFQDSNFEFFGFPIAYLPAFEIADPTVKRKSGFLIPSITFSNDLGVGVGVPYYFALSPTYDLTAKGTYYSKQGFLGEAEWRQRFDNGQYTLKMAGISQSDPNALRDSASTYGPGGYTVNSGPTGDNKLRGMMGTKGQFAINERWNFGWNVLLQSDKNFSRTYHIEGFSESTHRSEVYLTGLNDRNYFDLRAMHFDVQENYLNSSTQATSDKQPWVLPSLDYAYIPDTPLAGGQLSFNVNARAIRRNNLDQAFALDSSGIPIEPNVTQRVRGLDGDSGRLTGEAEWKRTFITDGGLVITPLLAFQADADYVNASSASLAAVTDMANNPAIQAAYPGVGNGMRSSFARYMATMGLEMRYPILFSGAGSSHVIEPMAQLFVRPNEQYVGGLAVPNEDAQSFVFDASTLFERDKFSGYDRIEGGTRANIGLRYVGSYDNGWTTNAIFGQSYQLAGRNSFASPDLVNAGIESGLEHDASDYVGLIGAASPNGLSGSLSGRFGEQDFSAQRLEARVGYSGTPVAMTASYAFIKAQPLYGFAEDRQETSLTGTLRFNENWRVFGSGTYDLQTKVLVRDGIGFGYADDCFTYLMTFSETRNRDPSINDKSLNIGFNISFRTLGDFGSSSAKMTPQLQ